MKVFFAAAISLLLSGAAQANKDDISSSCAQFLSIYPNCEFVETYTDVLKDKSKKYKFTVTALISQTHSEFEIRFIDNNTLKEVGYNQIKTINRSYLKRFNDHFFTARGSCSIHSVDESLTSSVAGVTVHDGHTRITKLDNKIIYSHKANYRNYKDYISAIVETNLTCK